MIHKCGICPRTFNTYKELQMHSHRKTSVESARKTQQIVTEENDRTTYYKKINKTDNRKQSQRCGDESADGPAELVDLSVLFVF